MFWQCCRRSTEEYPTSNGQDISKKQNKTESQEMFDMDIRISTISNGSLQANRNESTSKERVRTNSSSSVKSAESFYSIKSSATSASAGGDFYSICSADSYKST